MIDFLAFDETGALRARVDLVGDRLADLLARGAPIQAREVELVDLRTRGRSLGGDRVIEPGRLVVVVATGPRGSRALRVETTYRPVSIEIGGFLVHGFLHAPVPGDPVQHVFDRRWVPVTDAVLEYHAGSRICRERFDTLLLNRGAARTVTVITEAAHEVQWLASSTSMVFPELAVGV